MYIIRSETFFEIDSLQHRKISRQTYPANTFTNSRVGYVPVKNLRYNIHSFEVMLIFPK